MKILFGLLFIFLPSLKLYAQITPTTNSIDQLILHKVKSLSSYYLPSNSGFDSLLILKKEFDREGKLKNKYQLYIWDAVSYSYTTTYTYAENGLLKEELKIQEILKLFNRDEDYIGNFGDEPLHEKIMYYYNDKGQLTKKEIYTFSSELENSRPSQSIYYAYEDELLMTEESSSSNDKFFNRNYLINYHYDSAKRLSRKTRVYGNDLNMKRNTTFAYDSNDNVIEEKIRDESVPHNNDQYRYEYNDEGKLKHVYSFNDEIEDFELETTYTYDEYGNRIAGERDVHFEYYDNGLIKSESWINPTTDEAITFTTLYNYF